MALLLQQLVAGPGVVALDMGSEPERKRRQELRSAGSPQPGAVARRDNLVDNTTVLLGEGSGEAQ